MRVFSCFNGYSGGMAALKQVGIPVSVYYSSEIDKYCNIITQKNYPNTIDLGDIVKIRIALELQGSILAAKAKIDTFYQYILDLKTNGIDLLIGGSPCQGFSFAGKQLNFEDERSKLFFEFIKIKNILKPKYWLLENVRMNKRSEAIISKILGKRPLKINSALVSAQNRFRLYWTNIKVTSIPIDKNIFLKDILQPIEKVAEKYFVNIKNKKFNGLDLNKKSKCIRTGGKGTATEKHNWDIIKVNTFGNPKSNQNKSSCLTAGGNSGGNHSDMDVIIQKGRGFNKGGLFYEKSPTLTSNSFEWNHTVAQKNQTVFRRLTPIECERLQTLPDNFTAGVSDSQRYKMLGNGWTVAVIAFIFSFIKIN